MRAVAQHDMRQLVRQHARQLRFVLRRLEQPRMHVRRPSRQRERVDAVVLDHFEIVRVILQPVLPHQPHADPRHVVVQFLVGNDIGRISRAAPPTASTFFLMSSPHLTTFRRFGLLS